jgi:hypothetical protein
MDNIQRMSDTGDTFSEVPMTNNKSTSSLSAAKQWSKSSVSFSPKNVMSGCCRSNPRVQYESGNRQGENTTFIIQGGNSGSSSSSSSSLSQLFFFLPFFFLLDFVEFEVSLAASLVLHDEQSGTVLANISLSISCPEMRVRQCRHVAVANDPWHCRTRCTPATVSRVSIFWV